MSGEAALGAGRDLIAHTDVSEGAPHHNLMITASAAERVEVSWLDSLVDEVLAGGAVMRECPRWADVVRGHGIADLDQHPRAVDRFDGSWFGLDPLEEGRESDIGRGVVPAIQRP